MRPLKLRMSGFAAFREDTEVDFQDVELAALVGPTGSGKSTIIDGITFALFGSVARYDDARAVAPVINQLATEARVSLDFEVGSERYAAVRVVRRTPNGATTKEARLEQGEVILAGRASEMGPQVERLLGLDFDRFTKTVVLPQGRFARFLHDEPRKRQELLRHLLDLGVYTRMGEAARRRASEAQVRLDELEGQLDVAVPTEAEVAEIAATVEAARKAQADLGTLMSDLTGIGDELGAARAKVQRLEPLLRRAAEASEIPDAVRDLAGALLSSHEAVKDAEAGFSEASAAALEARRRSEEGPNAEVCRRLLRDREHLVQIDEGLGRLRDVEKEAKRKVADAESFHEAASAELEVATDALDRVRAVKSAEALVAQLEEGEPCPVCRQLVVTLPDHDIDRELEEVRADQARALREHKSSEAALRSANETSIATTTRREENESQREDLAGRLAGELDVAALKANIAEAEGLATARDEANEAEGLALEAQRATQAELRRFEGDEKRARGEFGSARDGLIELSPPQPGASLLEDWQELAAWAVQMATELTEQTQVVEQRAHDAAVRFGDVLEQARSVCAPYFDPGDDPAEFTAEMAVAVDRAKNAQAHAVTERRARARLEARIGALRTEAVVAAELGRLLRANGFEQWLLEDAVGKLVERANERLLELSSQQYSFVADGTSFDIRDHHNADEVRSAKTLSGGETFLASLALALALSDSQAEMATEGSPGLDSLFLDEGFGTLDPDALDVVAGAIEELGASGRMVCIVTHIRELAARMPVRFEVSKGPATSSVERVEV